MTPLSFDHATARAIVGDAEARAIEAKARVDADASAFSAPVVGVASTYWGQVQEQMAAVVYREQFTKRQARNDRKATREADRAA